MKRLSTFLKLFLVALVASFALVACDDEGETPQAPLAFFTFEADADNTQLINFTNETEGGETYLWEFGDNMTSTEMNPSHEYADGGTYTVKLTATNAGGDNVYSEEITVASNAAVNLVVNGELTDDSNWTVQQFNENNNGSVTFADEAVFFNEVVDIAEGGWGEAWAHAGMYQAIEIEAGTYIFDMDFVTEGINETWCEVWIGTTAPVENEEYNGEDGAVRIGLINAWDCPSTNTFSGSLSTGPECNPESFELTETATYYLVIRSGGFNFGPNGIKVDNLSLTKF